MEACATSHYWAREISAFGHDVRMMPARYVKPYVKRNKNNAADLTLIVGHGKHSSSPKWRLAKMPRQYVHIYTL